MRQTRPRIDVAVDELEVGAYTVPTDAPEADGTLSWDATTIVVVHAFAGGERGLGFSYTDTSAATLIESKLADVVKGLDALSPQSAWDAMVGAVRNAGRPGIGSMAIAAVDLALWDLKARLLALPLCRLIGMAHAGVPIYGSGGFTSYAIARLQEQLGGWVEQGIPRVKMKVGSQPQADPERVRRAREAIGPTAELFVDANGAYSRKQALELGERFRAEAGVSWFEEPVSSEDLEGLRLLRDRGSGRHADRRGRVRRRRVLLPPHARGGCRRRAPGGRHSLCRDHGAASRGRALPGPQHAAVAPLRSRRSTFIRRSPSTGSCTWSTSTTTSGSSSCCSTASSRPTAESCIRTSSDPETDSSSSDRRLNAMPRNARPRRFRRTTLPERSAARWWRNVSRGRAQRTLAAATAFSALPLGLEIYFEHFRGSFGDKWMWTPVALSPALTPPASPGCAPSVRPHVAAGHLGAVLRGRPDRRHHPRARCGPQARRVQRAAVQHRHGTAAARPGVARARRRAWGSPPRRSGGSADGAGRDFRDAGHLPNNRPDRQPGLPGGAAASAQRRHPADARALPRLQRARRGRPLGRGDAPGGARARRAHAADPILHRTGSAHARRLLRSRDGAGPGAEDPRAEHGRREAVRRGARRLSLRRACRATPRRGGGSRAVSTRLRASTAARRSRLRPTRCSTTSSMPSPRVSSTVRSGTSSRRPARGASSCARS